MPIRPATFADLVPTARILAAAFRDDELLGVIVHPFRDQYPSDMYLFFVRAMRQTFYAGPDHFHLVAYDTENGKERLTGYAHWIRKRSSEPRKQTLYQAFMTRVMSLYNYVESWVRPNRAIDNSKIDLLDATDPWLETLLVGGREERWYLSLLGIDPSIHRSGQGRQLVSYGLEQAEKEGIAAGLVASSPAEGFYRRLGFTVDLGLIGEVEGLAANPFADVEGGRVMFTK